MNLVFDDYCQFLLEKTGLRLAEGYFWLDNQIIKCYDKYGNIHKLYRIVVDENLNVSYKVSKDYSNLDELNVESWQETAKRKMEHILKLEAESMDLIRNSLKKYSEYKPEILISGGKDSSVTMYLVRQVLNNCHSIFNNTTLDCADTYRYVKQIENCQIITPHEGFYQWRKRYDFVPTRIARACCSIFKEGAMINVLPHDERHLFFMGMRNQESVKRADYQDEWQNDKWCENWRAILPIRKWSEEDIWLYILLRGIDINTKYKKGYSRVGCAIACPFAGASTWVLDKHFYPKMRQRWEDILKDDFIRNGKATILNCTLDEYINQCWNSPSFRDKPTENVISEFAEYRNISEKIAEKYFEKHCCSCDKQLKANESALSMKYFGRQTDKMFCMRCLSKELNRKIPELKEDIKRFKEQGCDLF